MLPMDSITEPLPIESAETFKRCFQDKKDPAFQRYIGRIRILERKSRDNYLYLRMKRERRLLPEYERLFIVPKEFLKYNPSPIFSPKAPENILMTDHQNILRLNMDLLAYFNKRNDLVQNAILHKLRRMVYWRTRNGTETEDRRKIDLLYGKIRNFVRLSSEDLDLFSRIMQNHYEKRHSIY